MKSESNIRKNSLDNTSATQAKINFICVVEEDLDYEHLQPAHEESNSKRSSWKEESEIQKRFKYLCYLRSMDDMV